MRDKITNLLKSHIGYNHNINDNSVDAIFLKIISRKIIQYLIDTK